MSEPTLYRIDRDKLKIATAANLITRLLKWGVLVPVERCEHGRWEGHWPRGKCHCKHKTSLDDVAPNIGVWQSSWLEPNKSTWKPCWHEPWCPGAGIGGDDE